MPEDNNEKKMESVYSKRLRAGKRRTYFFDVRATRGNDYFLTITESRKRFNEDGYDRHKIFLYKEDFNKFIRALNEAVDYVKTELMPDFDFDSYSHEYNFIDEESIYNPENLVDVSINLADDNIYEFQIEKILEAVNEFMEAIGCELEAEEEKVYGSFFQNLKYRFKLVKTENEVKNLYDQGKRALKDNHINLSVAKATAELTNAASVLIKSLEGQDQAVIRLGALLLVKVVKNGEPIVIIETVSPEIMAELNANSSLLRNPETLYDLLTKTQIEEAGW